MSIQIELRPEIEAELAAQAQRKGVPVIQYVQRILEQHVPGLSLESALTPEQRAKAFDDWAEDFPYRRSTPLSDDAISRESLYRKDDE
ncbi:MAG: hypothetical protein WCD04_13780 [Terriglobia bacterium]|jgi:hypothetical protein